MDITTVCGKITIFAIIITYEISYNLWQLYKKSRNLLIYFKDYLLFFLTRRVFFQIFATFTTSKSKLNQEYWDPDNKEKKDS